MCFLHPQTGVAEASVPAAWVTVFSSGSGILVVFGTCCGRASDLGCQKLVVSSLLTQTSLAHKLGGEKRDKGDIKGVVVEGFSGEDKRA